MTNDETACPHCGGETRLVTEASSGTHKKQMRQCRECGSPFVLQTEKKRPQRCDVPNCPDRRRCLDKDSPRRCALYRMTKRNLKVSK